MTPRSRCRSTRSRSWRRPGRGSRAATRRSWSQCSGSSSSSAARTAPSPPSSASRTRSCGRRAGTAAGGGRRTVSDSRMGRARPPLGSGSLFTQDEEGGEVFSSSYLSDLKEGHCSLLDDTGRMSELARRNTLAPAHLKSSYPVESQFCEDSSVTELSLQQSVLQPRRLADLPADTSRELAGVNSPSVRNLSQAASSLSLSSPAGSTRSKRSLSSLSSADLPAKRRPPVAFTVEAPRPGQAVRKSGRAAAKQPCTQEHGAGRAACATGEHRACRADLQELDTSQELFVPVPRALDYDTNATFVRDSLRGSKRSNVSYAKPGPPTPGRNRSVKSIDSAEANSTDSTVASQQSGVTPKGARSSTSRGPSTPAEPKPKFKGLTPLAFRKAIGSAFRGKASKTTYKLMKKQDETIDRDQSKSKGVKVTTPLKAKERLGKSPRTILK